MNRLVVSASAIVFASALGPQGCSRGSAPSLPVDGAGAVKTSEYQHSYQVGQEAIGAVLTIELNKSDLSFRVYPESRQGQAMGTLVDFDLVRYLNDPQQGQELEVGRVFRISELLYNQDDDLVIQFEHSHPFEAPSDPDAPAHPLSNRADLGYTGRLLILADALPDDESARFFPGPIPGPIDDIIANTHVVIDPDGYVRPTGFEAPLGSSLLGETNWANNFALTANTFPYVLLADDEADTEGNRFGLVVDQTGARMEWDISNSGDPRGNCFIGNNGWQKNNLQHLPSEEYFNWTGYDYIHQGQSVRNEFTISSEWLEQAPSELVVFRVAFLIKYSDPESVDNKLPPASIDRDVFAYRLPHSALDLSVVRFDQNESTFSVTPGGMPATMALEIRDWDWFAPVAPGLNLGANPDTPLPDESPAVNLVQSHSANETASGPPTLAVDVPAIRSMIELSNVLIGSGAGETYGDPDNPGLVTLDIGLEPGAQPSAGTYRGLVRLTDPEQPNILGNNPGNIIEDYHYGIDPADPVVYFGGQPQLGHLLANPIETFVPFDLIVENCHTPAVTAAGIPLSKVSNNPTVLPIGMDCGEPVAFSVINAQFFSSFRWTLHDAHPPIQFGDQVIASVGAGDGLGDPHKITLVTEEGECPELTTLFYYVIQPGPPSWTLFPNDQGHPNGPTDGRFSSMTLIPNTGSIPAEFRDGIFVAYADNDLNNGTVGETSGLVVGVINPDLSSLGVTDVLEDVNVTWTSCVATQFGVAVLFRDAVDGNLKLRYNDLMDDPFNTWHLQTIDIGDVTGSCDINALGNGTLVMSWRGNNLGLFFREQLPPEWGGPAWPPDLPNPNTLVAGLNDVGDHSDIIGYGAPESLLISYHDESLNTLSVARTGPAPRVWTSHQVDRETGVPGLGLDSRVSIQPNNGTSTPMIVYRQGTNTQADLRVAISSARFPIVADDWSTYSIADGEAPDEEEAGEAHGLGLDFIHINELPTVVYRSWVDGAYHARVARSCVSDPAGPMFWQISELESGDSVGWFPSIVGRPPQTAPDDLYRVVVSYWKPSPNELITRYTNATWYQ